MHPRDVSPPLRWAVFLCAFLAAGSAETRESIPVEELQFRGVAPLSSDGDVHALGDGRWLLADSETLRLQMGSRVHLLLEGSFESIDTRHDVDIDDRTFVLVSAL
ncbi:MAG: hypothetical protein AAGL66_13875, partial [Pseudomonadota bacterium]